MRFNKHMREPNYDPITAIIGLTAAAGTYSAYQGAQTAKKAASAQAAELAKADKARAAQDKLVAEEQAKQDAADAERRARLAEGRKGLLYAGDESGVTAKTTLG